MKTIHKLILLVICTCISTYATAQENLLSDYEKFRLNVLNEMPSLDFFGEAKYLPKEVINISIETIEGKKVFDYESFRLRVLNEMPSLDFHKEAKYYKHKPEMMKVAVEDMDVEYEKLRMSVLKEMPSLDFFKEVAH
ncbi:hypothetical protein [Wenyingzhuangia sp. IMCC45574]